ncbi:unnamed protein product [Arabidopsis thaliana]|uniref:(thale cress) hypothetical protein n=1 Tax=Arabidopsis thaliana TaxID=3702 RepID=A0A7G2EQ59_ARATH|nr:unnamed protein product [Arabidopsis thaliana]
MGKRKINSKYRSSTPDPPVIASPIVDDKSCSASPVYGASGSMHPPLAARSRSAAHPQLRALLVAPVTAANVLVDGDIEANAVVDNVIGNDDLSTEQMQKIVSFLNTRIHSSSPTPEVQAVSVPSLPTISATGPTPGIFHPSIICSFTSVDRPYACSTNSNLIAINTWVIDT